MLFPFDNPIIFLTTHCNMLCGLGASTFLFSIVSNNFNNTWHKPVVGAGGAVVLATVRTARRSQPALLPTRHTKFAGGYVVCSEENYELPRGSIFPNNKKAPAYPQSIRTWARG